MIFRFDDISVRSDMTKANEIKDIFRSKYPDCKILYAVSPAVADFEGERVFPKKWNAYSDYKNFYKITQVGLPMLPSDVTLANHGLIHCRHYIMPKGAQELSILAGCSLVNSKIFVPPFNMWNKHTEDICKENGIELIKFEDGWLSAEENKFDSKVEMWYLHAWRWTPENIEQWLLG